MTGEQFTRSPVFYVTNSQTESAERGQSMPHDNITDIYTYLRLCGMPHKRR